jgi:molybdenum cofactor synthesis domain-containing protein
VKTAGVLIVGDEILAGEVRDENGPYLVSRLTALGSRVARVAIVPDREPDVVGELIRLRGMADAVLVSGGIGPTHDDVTRPSVAAALGVPLEPHAEAARRIRRWYGDRTTEAELSMSFMPRGSRLLPGLRTGTFGFAVSGVYVMPGVPALLRDIVEATASEFAGPALHREEVDTGLREGEISDDLTRIQAHALDVAIGSYPQMDVSGSWSTKVVVRSTDPSRCATVASDVRRAFERLVAARSGPSRAPGP